MKKSTSLLFKLFLFSLILFTSTFKAKAWSPLFSAKVSDNTTDGYAVYDIYRYLVGSGNLINNNLYLQAETTPGTWINIYHTEHTVSGGKNYYSWNDIPGGYVSDADRGTVGSWIMFRLTIRGSPSGTYNTPVNFRWLEETNVLGNFSLTFYKPKAPTSFAPVSNICNRIDFSWIAPDNIVAGTNTYYIYRGTNNIYVGSTTLTTFSWSGPADGTSYDFKVRLRTNDNYGLLTNPVAGNSKPVPVAPTNVTASKNKCDGTIAVQWQWTAAAPNNFEVQRSSTSSTSGFVTLSNTLPGGNSSYEDTTPIPNTPYYYRVRAKNECLDWGAWSSVANGATLESPPDPTNPSHKLNGNIVHVTWNYSSQYVDKFVVTRTNVNTGVTNNTDIDKNVTFYDDDKAQLCIPYTYEIKAVNSCGNSNTITTGNVILTPDLSKTFLAEGSFKASKGFFPDVVHLEWDNLNRNQINAYFIYRNVFGSDDSTLLATLDGAQASYDDKYAENGILYTYSIIAEGLCDAASVKTKPKSDIGFRNPSAVVSGKITYGQGEPVQGVVVSAESSELLPTTSIALNGINSYLEIPDKNSVDIQNKFSFQAYIRPSELKSFAVFNKGDQYALNYTGTAFEFSVGTTVLNFSFALEIDKYIHVSVVYDGTKSQLYLDGELMMEQAAVSPVANTILPFVIGAQNSANYLSGYVDEIRIWKVALTPALVKSDFNRYISYKNNNLIGYYRLNENIASDVIFDISKSDTKYNENHGILVNGLADPYSDVVPDIEQLWFKGLTDAKGDYLITGIPYATDGSSFNIVPMLAPHEFNPGSKTLFVSDESRVHNNIDFKDISSFDVSGLVQYNNTNLGVSNVKILVDGVAIFGADSKQEVTDKDGKFVIKVPIGYHYISFEKDGHGFDYGGWEGADPVERYNFTGNLDIPIPFSDTTLITVVGRVIGGTGSNAIPFGFGQSVNNIGKATITLDHSSFNPELTFDNKGAGLGDEIISYQIVNKIDGSNVRTYQDIESKTTRTDIETKIYTSPETGEFVARLIPENFVIVNIKVDNDADNHVKTFFKGRKIELAAIPSLKKEYLYDKDSTLLDSISYHVKLNYIYQVDPDISVTNTDDTKVFYGEKVMTVKNPTTGLDEVVTIADHFKYPVFNMFSDYSPKFSVFESYHNYDSGTDTRQAVKEAQIKIINDLAIKDNIKTLKLTPEMNGVIVDQFKVGIPNVATSVGDGTSFTKTMEIHVTVDGNVFSWPKNGPIYRAYILGQRPKGNNFYTGGPQIPEIILRDPPGSKSYAYIEKGSGYTVSSGYSSEDANNSGNTIEYKLGVKIKFGGGLAGPVIETEVINSGEAGLSYSTEVNESGEYVKSITFNERVETSSDPGVVGSMGDIYIGKSYNYFYGESDNLKIVDYQVATDNGITALDDTELKDTQYTLGIVDGYIIDPDSKDTYFKYTQAHIINKLLPELEKRRNNLFISSKRSDGTPKYKNEFTKADLRFGIAHEYTAVDATTIKAFFKMSDTENILSYEFYPEKITVEDINKVKDREIYEVDSVRYYNEQIGLWIDALRLNETEKALAIKDNTLLEQNISFDGAVGAISRSEVQTITYNKEEVRTKKMAFTAEGSMGFEANGLGVRATGEMSISNSLGVTSGESQTQTMEYGYVLEDGDVGDYYSMNIYRRKDNGVYKAADLDKNKLPMPSDFDYTAPGVIAGLSLLYGPSGGAGIVATAATMSITAAASYSPYNSFKDQVQVLGTKFQPGDFRVGSFDISSPIFSTLGGQTMCPFQNVEETVFYFDEQQKPVQLHKATLQREKPAISAAPTEVFNVPVTDKAFFTLKLTNDTESGDDQWYTVQVDEKTNQKGAIIKIDGASGSKTIFVPAGKTVNKILTIQPSDLSVMNYDNIGIVMHSACQFDPTDFIADISDTVFISASFQAACTNVEIREPSNNWLVNVRNNDTLSVQLGDYNLAHASFRSFRFEYKSATGSLWVPVKYFVNDPLLANTDNNKDTVLINNGSTVTFDWDMTGLKDGKYDIRAVSVCSDGSENESVILSGILDGIRPQVFGTPQPGDGILNIDENISLQFNEPINGALLTPNNFSVKGTKNNSQLKHDAYIRYNGTSDYSYIPEGITFNDKSFTIEMWVLPVSYGNSVILSQGNDPATSLEIGLKDGFKTYFKIGNVEYEAPFQFTPAVPSAAWQHMAYVFDYETGDVFIYQNDKIILEVRGASVDYSSSGKIYVGKSSVTGGDNFEGSIHELRIWSKYISKGDVNAIQYKALSGNEVGLYGYWPMDEAFGDLSMDKAANRHMEISANWEVDPGGSSWDFAGNNFLEFNTGYFSVTPEMDYTVEFWFRDNNPADTVCLFSNQKGDGKEGPGLLDKALSIYATPNGKIWISSKGNTIEAVSNDYFDNSWHHFAMVVRRRGNVTTFIDGQAQLEKENTIVGGIAGGMMHLGVRIWDNVKGTGQDRFYSGKLDEFRLWNLAKTTTQLRLDMNSKLHGDEIGLMVYLPMEGFYENAQGLVSQQTSLENFVSDVNATNAVSKNGDAFSLDAPNIKNFRQVESIGHDFISSEDQIIINPTSDLVNLEKNIIEITVQDVEDKYGNRMASPVTWTAYVHRNQVNWEDERRSFTKELYKPLQFVSSIKNTGGQQIGYDIISLPSWLTANPSSGVINPESTKNLTFTVNSALDIGEYNADIILRTDNGYDEKLPVTVKVFKTPPNWKVDPSKFEYTMNMVGKIKIEGVLSTDIFDMVAAFKSGTDSIRGVANVRYLKQFDSYLLFLNVYGNISGEQLDFRIWDASVGQILDNVKPFDVKFVPNGVVGTTIDPQIFEAVGLYRQYLPLAKGWNWVSFNKLAPNQNNLNSFLSALNPTPGVDQIKIHGAGFNTFDSTFGWVGGSIDSIDNKLMYQVKISNPDTIIYSGEKLSPANYPITLKAGWNHISYIPDLAMDVNDALRLYVAKTSEIIKSQYAFSMYDPRVGWIGTLEFMQPGLGYMFKVDGDGTLTYPNSTIFKGAIIPSGSGSSLVRNNNLAQYEGNMSVVARLDFSGTPDLKLNSQMVLEAIIGDESHGSGSPITGLGIGYEPFFLNVSNTINGQQVGFRLSDGLTGKVYGINEERTFAVDAVHGNLQNPLVLSLNGLATSADELQHETFLRCYPNPFNQLLSIEFNGTSEALTIEVVNNVGTRINQIYDDIPESGINKIVWDGKNQRGSVVSAGIYYLRFVSGNSTETIKISKTK